MYRERPWTPVTRSTDPIDRFIADVIVKPLVALACGAFVIYLFISYIGVIIK